ncbi:MAG: hypothetical protein MUF61_01545 [archaeon]|nr:hypothetical protein [archaeon]
MQKQASIFDVNAPKDAKTGEYELGLNVECLEIMDGITFTAEIIQKKIIVSLNDATKEDGRLKISYSLQELAGETQDVEVEIVLLGQNNERISELKEQRTISPSSTNKFETYLNLPEDTRGNLNLLINAKSKIASAFVQEYVLLEGNALGGFVVFDSENSTGYISAAIVVAFLAFAFIVGRRILKYRRIQGRKSIIFAIASGLGYHKHNWDNRVHRHEEIEH